MGILQRLRDMRLRRDRVHNEHRASFLIQSKYRMTNIMSRHCPHDAFESHVNELSALGDDTMYILLSNVGDGRYSPVSLYEEQGITGKIDMKLVDEFSSRLRHVTSIGFRVVLWFFSPESGAVSTLPVTVQQKYMGQMMELFDAYADSYGLAFDVNEHMSYSRANALARYYHEVNKKPLGLHMGPGLCHWSAKIGFIDVHYHNYGFGKSPSQIHDETVGVRTRLRPEQRLIAAEYNTESESENAREQGTAAIAGGAVGTGNGRG